MIYEQLVKLIYLPRMKRLDHEIGCALKFKYIPDRYINSIMSCEMTQTWKKFGLDVVKGKNHFTIGKVQNGISSRFDKNSPAYQSWLGGYTVLLGEERMFTPEEHFKLAIADQNSWLRWYGDANPDTNTLGFVPTEAGTITLGNFTGKVYEFGCQTHSDVGAKHEGLKLMYASDGEAVLYNLGNPSLHLKPSNFVPHDVTHPYEVVNLKGLIAIFDIKPKVKVVLYANGTDKTFIQLKEEFMKAFQACEIKAI